MEDRISIRRAQQKQYAAGQASLAECNRVSSEDTAKFRKEVDTLSQAAVRAVARTLNTSVPVDVPEKKVKSK